MLQYTFLDNMSYFVTGAIYQKRPLLDDSELKEMLFKHIREHFEKFHWQLHHWVILDNHYHVLGQSWQGHDLANIFKGIHGTTARLIREATQCDLPVWWNYWDYCPRNEHQYLTRANYLLYNPVKHGYVRDLHDYAFSSFHTLFENMGRERLAKQFREYSDYKTLVLYEAKKDDF